MKRLHFHCQHSLGLGHLVRSFALAEAFARSFEVSLFVGGRLPSSLPAPRDVTLRSLPALRMGAGTAFVAEDAARALGEVLDERREILLRALRESSPDCVVVELFPFGRKQLAPELLPWLEAAQRRGARVFASVRDILVTRRDPEAHDARAAAWLETHFDGVLVHADPQLARFEDSFRPSRPVRTPIHYTGLVTRAGITPLRPRARRRGVLVSAGGGRVGEQLLAAALAAQPRLWEAGMPMHVIGGPFADDVAWERFERESAARAGLRFTRSLPDLRPALAEASVSVSQCGYNTAVELIATQTPSVVIPFEAPFEDEQRKRAVRLEAAGWVRTMRAADANPEQLADAIRERARCRLPRTQLDLSGAERSRMLLVRELEAPR